MESERWQQIKELLIGLSQREESDRHVFLEQACAGDENLRDEVESLLMYEKESEDLIELPPRKMVADLLTQYESDSELAGKSDSSEVMTGKTVARYRILEQLGAGGMGTVYKAEDTELGRFVALKFLSGSAIEPSPTNLSPDKSQYSTQALERFRREARAASALDHPNICIVHDVDQHEGVPFIVMQFLSGQTLKQEIDGKALPTDRILDLAIQIANALDAAHKASIVHRDIKSANILVTELGEAKVLDFGLAKLGAVPLTASETVESLRKVPTQISGDTMSRPGTALGTVAYMSPEQVLGKEIDARSDLFSLGVVLYEMATGTVPFKGETLGAIADFILHKTPTSTSELNSSLPEELERIINKALEKDRERRYQMAADLRDDLTNLKRNLDIESNSSALSGSKVRRGALALGIVCLGVVSLGGYLHFNRRQTALPAKRDTVVLANLTNTTGESIFDETLQQALRVQLGQSPHLAVLSDEETKEQMQYMGRSGDAPLTVDVAETICLRTGGKAILKGSISRIGSHYVLGLHAFDCTSGKTLGDEQEEADNRERVLNALGVTAARMRVKLGESLATIMKYNAPLPATTGSLEALQADSAGRKARNSEGEEAAIPFFKKATELDPDFALAWAHLGNAYFDLNQPSLASAAMKKAYDLRDRVSVDEKSYIESHYYDTVTGQLDNAIQAYQIWLQANDNVGAHVNLGVIYSVLGQHEKNVEQQREALKLQPSLSVAYSNLVNAYLNLNQFDKAKETLEQARAHDAEEPTFYGLRYQMAFMNGDSKEMDHWVAKATGQPGIEGWLLAMEADSNAYYGRLSKARRFTQRAIDSARRYHDEETALDYEVIGALREAEFGNLGLVKKRIEGPLVKTPSQPVHVLAALALARTGQPARALELARDINRQFPLDTVVNSYWLPTIRAAAELGHNNPTRALESLQPALPYEFGAPQLPTSMVLYPVYVRGSAYLAAGLPNQAEAEFQKIVDHRGLTVNCLLGALAHLGIGRAYALEAGIPVVPTVEEGNTQRVHSQTPSQPDARAKARSAYQDFFSLWKDADPDIPLLKQARMEYRRLQ